MPNLRQRPRPTASSVASAAAPTGRAKLTTEPTPIVRKAVAPFKIGPVKPVRLRWTNQMVYGPFGHGKTTYAATALDVPEMTDVLFIAAEPGDMSLTSRRDLDIVTINQFSQFARVFDYLSLHCDWRDEGNVEKLLQWERELKDVVIPVEDQTPPVKEGRTWFEEQRLRTGKPMDEPYLYRTVIVDNLSEVHKYLVYSYTGVVIGETKLDEEIEKMDEWQPAQEKFRLLIRSFRDLRMHVIFVASESLEPAERNKRRNPRAGQALPKLAGQAAADVAGFIDVVGYLVREIEPGGDTHRYLYLGAGYEGWISKHRFENLPDLDYLSDPTLTKLFDLARKDTDLHGASLSHASSPNAPVSTARNAASTNPTNRSSAAPNSPAGSSGGRRLHAVRRA